MLDSTVHGSEIERIHGPDGHQKYRQPKQKEKEDGRTFRNRTGTRHHGFSDTMPGCWMGSPLSDNYIARPKI